jgi:hypothetical protein
MSSFKTIKQQNTEKFIEKLFDGLDDPCLKAVFRVMYGLEDETVLDQLRIVNEQNLKDIESALTITDAAVPEGGEPTVSPTPPSLPLSNEEGVRGNVVPSK